MKIASSAMHANDDLRRSLRGEMIWSIKQSDRLRSPPRSPADVGHRVEDPAARSGALVSGLKTGRQASPYPRFGMTLCAMPPPVAVVRRRHGVPS
jgi:hypothetical protein